MVEKIIRALIYIGFMAMAFWLILWALDGFGLHIPAMVEHIAWVIFILFVILVLYKLLWEPLSNYNWWGTPPNP